MTMPEILCYHEGDDDPRFMSRRAFEALLTEHRDAVLNHLNAAPRRGAGPLRPVWVDVLRGDGSTGVGAVAGHGAPQEPAGDDSRDDAGGGAF